MTKKLTKKQLALISDIFAGESDEETILKKHNVAEGLFNKWLCDEHFKAEFVRRIDWLNLQSQALIARCTSLAAAKLVALTDSKKEETRRKACLDILSLPKLYAKKQDSPSRSQTENHLQQTQLTPETASRILEVLAKPNPDDS